jgi:hypothetical protein
MEDLFIVRKYIFDTYGVDLQNDEIAIIVEFLKSNQIQPVLNLLGKKSNSISVISDIVLHLKNKISIEKHTEPEPIIIGEVSDAIEINKQLREDGNNIDNWIVRFWKWVLEFFVSNDVVVISKQSQVIKDEGPQNEKEDSFFILVDNLMNELKKESKISGLSLVKNPYGLKFIYGEKKYYLCPKKISSAHLPNKDSTRVQFSGSINYEIHGQFIPVGIDVQNKVFVFWNPVGFLSRVINNKNSSFYSSLAAQKLAKNSGIELLDLHNEKIIISGIDEFRNAFFNQLHLLDQSKRSIYEIDGVYNDFLSVKSIYDQISRWMATDGELNSNKNPFNNYRGIRTLEFSSKKMLVPAFFIFVSTLSKRKDNSASIWSDSFDENSNSLYYHGDAKPGRDFLHPQNQGNCRLWNIQLKGRDCIMPPVLYFNKIGKKKMQFKGVFKIIEMKQSIEVFEGVEFKNIKLILNRDNLIQKLDCRKILEIRETGLDSAQKIGWYFRNCNHIYNC